MHLAKGLEILIEDWRALHEDGGTKLSVEAVVGKLVAGSGKGVTPGLKPDRMADLIISILRQSPHVLESAEQFMAHMTTSEELLDEMDLDCLVCDLWMMEDDNQSQA